jgi:hypothetical protein
MERCFIEGDRVRITDVAPTDAFAENRGLLIGLEFIVKRIAVHHWPYRQDCFGGDFYFTPCSGGVFFVKDEETRKHYGGDFLKFLKDPICFYNVKLELVREGPDGDQARDPD